MSILRPSDLFHQDTYRWTEHPEGDPRVSGPPDDTPFDRESGPEVLYLLSWLCEQRREQWAMKTCCLMAEAVLHSQLPAGPWTQIEVVVWLETHPLFRLSDRALAASHGPARRARQVK